MTENILVLNSHYVPVNITNKRRVVNYLLKDKVDIVHLYKDKVINFGNGSIELPSVIRLKHYVNLNKKMAENSYFSKMNIYIRDEGVCQYCGKPVTKTGFTLDHVIPKSKGGGTNWNNIVTCCQPCNSKKGNKLTSECGMYPLNKPVSPLVNSTVERTLIERMKRTNMIDESWLIYLK